MRQCSGGQFNGLNRKDTAITISEEFTGRWRSTYWRGNLTTIRKNTEHPFTKWATAERSNCFQNRRPMSTTPGYGELPREHQTRVPCRECSADCAKETVAFAKRKPIYSARLRKQAVDVDFGPCADVDLAVGDTGHGELDGVACLIPRGLRAVPELAIEIGGVVSVKDSRSVGEYTWRAIQAGVEGPRNAV